MPDRPQLICSMSVSVDGFINDREGGIGWGNPSEDQFRLSIEQVGDLGAYILGRRLYAMMLPWEQDPAMRATGPLNEFADIWCALPKIVFSRSLDRVEGNARLAEGSLAEEIAAALTGPGASGRDVSIGGADLIAQAVGLDLLDEIRMFRNPLVLGGGTPLLPPVAGPLPLELVETRTLGGRVVYERYSRLRATPDHRGAGSASQ